MKPIEGYNKLRGGYYTPDKISEFIAEWAIRKTSDSVLEIIILILIQRIEKLKSMPLRCNFPLAV